MADDNRGFASMDESKQKDIAREGVKSSSRGSSSSRGGFSDRKKASEAGKKGGQKSRRTS